MATLATARLLTETHRLAQVRIGALTKQQMQQAWPALDLEHLDATFPDWLAEVSNVVGSAHSISSATAGSYYRAFRTLELGKPAKPFSPLLAAAVDPETLKISMRVTGPVAVKTAIGNGEDLADASDIGFTRSSGAAMRHALAGGRDTLTGSSAADPSALGWARAASGDACAFCAMLAGRGPVYSEDTVDFEAHDHCSCSAEPVFSHDQEWPDRSSDYRDLYNEATSNVPDDGDLLNTFRRALESRSSD